MLRVFTLTTIIPLGLLTVSSVFLFDLGLENWFSARVRGALLETRAVAQAYLEEHIKAINADAFGIGRALANRRWSLQNQDNVESLSKSLAELANSRNIAQAVIFKSPGQQIIARFGLTFSLEFDSIPAAALERANAGEVVVLPSSDENIIRALIQIDNYVETYLLIVRDVAQEVLLHIERSRNTLAQFESAELRRGEIQFSYSAVIILLAMSLFFLTIWFAMRLSHNITNPIEKLLYATQQITKGNLNTNVAIQGKNDDEIFDLGKAFNQMTKQLSAQRAELISANEGIDQRRRFSEAVLSAVSAGVIGLDGEGRIDLSNERASVLVGINLKDKKGMKLSEIIPDFEEILSKGKNSNAKISEYEIDYENKKLLVRIAPQWIGEQNDKKQDPLIHDKGMVITFDDISLLIVAQRKAAWSDVARRIAHEVRNPLTPIQLSAERLRRRFGKQIKTDDVIFAQLIDTIIRQVGDIGKLVEEFSNFARMPKPKIERYNLVEICKEVILLQNSGIDSYEICYYGIEEDLYIECDARQIAQILINLIKNARESISSKHMRYHKDKNSKVKIDKDKIYKGKIDIKISSDHDFAKLCIYDNGEGFPIEKIHTVSEPYITFKEQGTGLGLSIVKKIV
ncbi:MAG: histidine kinase dimerization/phospho-acceptor domain-containing protein, partial [Pseudomonadota bacterium]